MKSRSRDWILHIFGGMNKQTRKMERNGQENGIQRCAKRIRSTRRGHVDGTQRENKASIPRKCSRKDRKPCESTQSSCRTEGEVAQSFRAAPDSFLVDNSV